MNTEKPLTFLLGQTMHLVKLRLVSTFKDANIDLSLEHFVILLQINSREDLTQQDLANHFQRDKSIILRQINTLIDSRYVTRMVDKDDKRKKNLLLTKKGFDVLVEAKNLARQVSAELLKGISDEEMSIFENVIEKIQQNTGHSAPQPNC